MDAIERIQKKIKVLGLCSGEISGLVLRFRGRNLLKGVGFVTPLLAGTLKSPRILRKEFGSGDFPTKKNKILSFWISERK